MRMLSLFIPLAISSAASQAAHAQATITGLGDLVQVHGISGDGAIVVGDGPDALGRRWTDAGGTEVILPMPPDSVLENVLGVSGDGAFIVGRKRELIGLNFFREAYRWSGDAIGYLGADNFSQADAISDDGSTVVGYSTVTCISCVADHNGFRWTETGSFHSLGHLGTQPGSTISATRPKAVSANGSVITGNSSNGEQGYQSIEAFRWTEAGGIEGIGDLPGGAKTSDAFGISADGSTIVGQGNSTSGSEAFRWENTGTCALDNSGPDPCMAGLGDLPGGTFNSVATDVSADGSVIVGWGIGVGGQRAFIWDKANGMRELGSVISPIGSGWQLVTAEAISNDGLVIAGSGINSSGDSEGWVVSMGAPMSVPALDPRLAALVAVSLAGLGIRRLQTR